MNKINRIKEWGLVLSMEVETTDLIRHETIFAVQLLMKYQECWTHPKLDRSTPKILSTHFKEDLHLLRGLRCLWLIKNKYILKWGKGKIQETSVKITQRSSEITQLTALEEDKIRTGQSRITLLERNKKEFNKSNK